MSANVPLMVHHVDLTEEHLSVSHLFLCSQIVPLASKMGNSCDDEAFSFGS